MMGTEPEPTCRGCGATFVLPRLVPCEFWKLALETRGYLMLPSRESMRLIDGRADIPELDKKNIQMHLARPDGTWHQCHRKLNIVGRDLCTGCGALNIWFL